MDLPVHKRKLPVFTELLGSEAGEVIRAMDRANDDIALQIPEYPIDLPSVGIQRHNIPIRIYDPLGSNNIISLYGDVFLSTCVPSHKRGIHTSRIGDALAKLTTEIFESLQQYASRLAREISLCQYGGPSQVHVCGTYSYLEKIVGWTPEKNKESLEHIGLQSSVCLDRDICAENAGITINHLTACPCVQQSYKHALQSRDDTAKAVEPDFPLFTHSQRCKTTIEIRNLPGPLPTKALLKCLDQVIFRTQNTLPREYELLLVYQAHRRPQFIEDALCQMIFEIYSSFGSEFRESSLHIHSSSMESIHDFDLVANFGKSFKQLKDIFAPQEAK